MPATIAVRPVTHTSRRQAARWRLLSSRMIAAAAVPREDRAAVARLVEQLAVPRHTLVRGACRRARLPPRRFLPPAATWPRQNGQRNRRPFCARWRRSGASRSEPACRRHAPAPRSASAWPRRPRHRAVTLALPLAKPATPPVPSPEIVYAFGGSRSVRLTLPPKVALTGPTLATTLAVNSVSVTFSISRQPGIARFRVSGSFSACQTRSRGAGIRVFAGHFHRHIPFLRSRNL